MWAMVGADHSHHSAPREIKPVLIRKLVPAIMLLTAPCRQVVAQDARADSARRRALAACPHGGNMDVCLTRRFMAFDLKYAGRDALEHWIAVKMGVERARLFPVRLRDATKDDSALYKKLEVTQWPSGGFEAATSLGGTQPRNESGSRRAATVVPGLRMVWGILLSEVAQRLAACADSLRDATRETR